MIAEKKWEKQEVPLGSRKEMALVGVKLGFESQLLPLTAYVIWGRLDNSNKPQFHPL